MNAGKRWLLATAVVIIGASMSLAIACSDDSDDGGDADDTPEATEMDHSASETDMEHGANEVHVYETEYEITGEDGAPITSPSAGSVAFEVHNDGTIQHDFVVIKTDLDAASLPVEGTTVDEEGQGIEVIDEIVEADAGEANVLTVDLEAGKYVLICNVAGHYVQGMYASLEVM